MDSALLSAVSTSFTEFYYWVTVVFMFLIHVGFCVYETGASRYKHHMHTLMKNTMVIPLVSVTWFLFGWWIYWGLPYWPFGDIVITEVEGGNFTSFGSQFAYATSNYMAPRLDDRINGVFWAAFLLFSWTAASIVSGSVIERIKSSGFWILAVAIGSVFWVVDAAWGWNPDGWMVRYLGYHDAYASGVIHGIAGGFALGVLAVLGPRLAKFSPTGEPRNIAIRNPWLVTVGLFLIYTGFWGFYVACNVPYLDIGASDGGSFFTATTIYGTPVTLSGITFNFIMSLSGGMMAAYAVSKGDVFWTYSGGLAGIIAASAGNDLYHPIQSLLIAAVTVPIIYKLHFWVERKFKIDDAVGAVAVHGYAGFIGVTVAGFMLWGYPASLNPEFTTAINPLGNFIGAIIMCVVLGFIPGYVISRILKACNLLRVPHDVELEGLDKDVEEQMVADEEAVANIEKSQLSNN
jgi:ammonia channel protein AmtB